MTPRTALILVVLAVISVAGGWQLDAGAGGAPQPAETGQLAFPALGANLAKVASIEVQHAGRTLVIDTKDGNWVSEAAGGYPVIPGKLRMVLGGLAELRLMEPRTSDPAMLSRLGVEDPAQPGSAASLLSVFDAGHHALATLVLGHRRLSGQGGVPEQIYVRRPDQAQAWLAEGRLEVDDDPASWLDRQVADIAPEAIASATAQPPGAPPLALSRAGGRPDGAVTVISPADHPPVDQNRLDDVFRAYQYLSFTDVKPAAPTLPGAPAGASRFVTSDGMVLTATVSKDKDTIWASFAVTGDGESAKPAAALEAKVKGWMFQFAGWKQQALAPTLDALKSVPPPPQPTPQATP